MDVLELIEFEDRYHEDFRRLNLEWLDKYQLTESHDLMILDNPRGTVLDGGGIIFLARISMKLSAQSAC